MMRSNSSILSRKSSRVGKAIRLNSSTGTPSCFSGGRRIVKCTRSTLLSDFRRLRQVRSPACGSPETRSTRRRSRTPFIWITAALLRAVSSPGASGVAKRMTLLPPCGRVTGSSRSSPTGTSKTVGSAPSTEMESGARPRISTGTAPSSSRRSVSVTSSPRMAKAGAPRTVSRLSQSEARPVVRTWKGAGSSGSASASCACPSVRAMTPATRALGSSESAWASAAPSRVPPSPGASGTETRRTSVFGRAARRAASASAAAAVRSARSPMRWEAVASSARITMSGRGSRSSVWSDGPASASTSAAAARARSHQPGRPRQSASSAAARARALSATTSAQGKAGSKTMLRVMLLSQPVEQGRHVDLVGFVVARQHVHHEVDAEA